MSKFKKGYLVRVIRESHIHLMSIGKIKEVVEYTGGTHYLLDGLLSKKGQPMFIDEKDLELFDLDEFNKKVEMILELVKR